MPKDQPAAHGSPHPKYWRRPLDADKVKVPHGELHILTDRCKGCMFCVEYCPRDVLEMAEDFNAKGYHYPVAENDPACVNCRLCEMLCPEFAIFCLEVKEESVDDS
jgi:2-oxoglutarate ferredoxin oxidoreductase subunit delta